MFGVEVIDTRMLNEAYIEAYIEAFKLKQSSNFYFKTNWYLSLPISVQ
jgi:hypothetical protein